MNKSGNYSDPEYSDDEIEKKPIKKVEENVKIEKITILPPQMGYKAKDQFASKLPPPQDLSVKPQFYARRNAKRNERREHFGQYEKSKVAPAVEMFGRSEKVMVKHQKMTSTNFRPSLKGAVQKFEDIKIYYQDPAATINITPCIVVKAKDTFESVSKSQNSPEFKFRRLLDATLVQNLRENEIIEIRPVQAAVMTAVFTYPYQHPETSKADILATSETGSGKTLAFLIPILQKAIERREQQPNIKKRFPMALIFVYTTELAMSFFHVIRKFLNGLRLKVVAMAASLNFIEDTNFDIGICTNGRFQNHFSHTLTVGDKAVALNLRELEYILIDEADKMVSDLKFVNVLAKLKEEPKNPRIFAFSATIDTYTAEIMRNSSIFKIKCGQHNVIPSNIKQFFWQVQFKSVSCLQRNDEGTATLRKLVKYSGPPNAFDTLYSALTQAPHLHNKRILVFVKHTCSADLIAVRLHVYGVPAVSIHKKLNDVQTPIDMFIKGEVNVAIVTEYFTRGIDTEVDVVINFDLPILVADFIHRCGRTGRNGNLGIAITFIDISDPVNYNPKVIQHIAESLPNQKDVVIPFFLQHYLDYLQNWK
uniref:ATP-dependent RNA helicase n=1 Tax=Panagrolaimus superbus TaxID=310955 RepID=A0A914XXL8_9BILA